MFRERSLKFKLLFAFGALSAAVIGMTTYSLYSMKGIKAQYSHISDVTMPNVQAVGKLTSTFLELNRLTMRVSMGMNNGDAATVERNGGEFPMFSKQMDELDKKYRSLPFAEGEEALYDKMWNAWKIYEGHANKFLVSAKKGLTDEESKKEATQIIESSLKDQRQAVIDAADALINFQDEDSTRRTQIASSHYETTFKIMTILAIVVTVLAGLIGYVFSNYINKTISGIADGIRSSADQTSLASHELTSASSTLSQGATESAASLEETVSSLEELSSMVKLNSDHAKEANTLSKKSLMSAENGEKEIHSLVDAMSNMAKSSKKIEEIINVIDDIAFQTNLLALNAAVEAARAGEQGKGFAVVADAVRNLAGRSAIAAKDINNLIKENVEMTESGVRIADTSGNTLKEIVDSAKKVADLNAEISAASQEQANGIEQISKAMNHLDQAIQGNASSSEEVASSATEMSSQADALINMVKELKSFVEGGDSQESQQVVRTAGREEKKVPAFKKPVKSKDLDDHEIPFGKADGF